MISRLTISNYRSIGPDVSLALGRLTALVGPNAAGKSSFLDALQFLADCFRKGLPAALVDRQGFAAVRRWSSGHPYDVTLGVALDDEQGAYAGEYTVRLGGDSTGGFVVKSESGGPGPSGGLFPTFERQGNSWLTRPGELHPHLVEQSLALPLLAGDDRYRLMADALQGIAIYSIYPDVLRAPQPMDASRPMQENGRNWTSLLLQFGDEPWADDLRAALGRLTGDISDLQVRQLGSTLVAEFQHAYAAGQAGLVKHKWLSAAQESDGTLRVAGILTALLQQPTPTLIGIEEPELTVQPGALPLLYDFLVEASRRTQVVVTTHSPDLLALFDPDDVRVVERRNGVTTVAPLDPAQRDVVAGKLLDLGDVHRMEGLRQDRTAAD